MSRALKFGLAGGLILVAAVALALYSSPSSTPDASRAAKADRPAAPAAPAASDLPRVKDDKALPLVESYLSKLSGAKVKITYQSRSTKDGVLTLDKVVISTGGANPRRVLIDRAVFSRMEPVFGRNPYWLVSGKIMGLSGGLGPETILTADVVEFKDLRLHRSLALVEAKLIVAENFSRTSPYDRIGLGFLQAKRLRLERPGLLAIAAGEIKDLSYQRGGEVLKLSRLSVLGAEFRDLSRPSPFDAAKVELEGLAALHGGKEFASLDSAKLLYDQASAKRKLKLALSGLKVQATGAPRALAGGLRSLGYEQVSIDLELKAKVDLDSQRLEVDGLTISSPQMGSLEFELELGGFEIDPRRLARMSLWSALLLQRNVSLISAEFTYKDASLVPRVLAQRARAWSITPAQHRDSLIARMRQISSLLGAGADPLVNALIAFVRKPGKIEVRLHPKEPVALLGLTVSNPRTIAAKLGLSAEAE